MRGIRFVRHLCKRFPLAIINGFGCGNYYFYNLTDNKISFLLYFYHNYILLTTLPSNKFYSERFKYSEKYKIKQIIHEALSE